MARQARQRAESGVYYVLLRSKGNEIIFPSDSEAVLFLNCLKEEREKDFTEVYAYCLFNDAVHLVIKEGLSGISRNIMRISSTYVSALNERYERSGPLFYDRFYSEPLEEDRDILLATRLVHRAPLKMGLSLNYEWSSYPVYFKRSDVISGDAVVLAAGSIINFKLFTEREY